MWYLPGPRIKPVSSALAGKFLTTAPPGKSMHGALLNSALIRFKNVPGVHLLDKLNRIIIWPSKSTPRVISKGIEIRNLNKNLSMNIHSGNIHNSQKVEITEMSKNWWMDKQNAVYPCNGILFSHGKEWSTDTCYNMDEHWKHCTKWKKAGPKGHILYGFYSYEISRISKSIET